MRPCRLTCIDEWHGPFDRTFACGYGDRLMTLARHALGPLAAVWLACQLATVTLAPVLLWATATNVHVDECTCTHGTDALCPMHHKRAPRSTICVMQSTTDQATLLSASLFGFVGLVPGFTMVIDAAPPERVAILGSEITTQRPVPPDPPPPRA